MQRTILILGATGGVGGESARALVKRGWHVRALTRTPRANADGIEWITGDALDADAVMAAAAGAQVLLHAVNPPAYRGWSRLAVPMLENSIAAALAHGARLAFPGTIYNYDPAATPIAREESPQHPTTRKGRTRTEMEDAIAAATDRGTRALILRAGDFFGPKVGNNWLSQGMITPGKPIRSVRFPGRRGVGHAWAYLPDVGETFAQLIDRDEQLAPFARYNFGGMWDDDGTVMTNAIASAVGRPDLPVKRLPWPLLPLIAPFDDTVRELIEMKPFWDNPVELDNRALIAELGSEPHTPIDLAMRTTLTALGCLP